MVNNSADKSESLQIAYEEALERFSEDESITGIDKGVKYIGGKPTDTIAIRFHVKKKLSGTGLEAENVYPSEIQGIPTDVIEATYEPHQHPTSRIDPLQPGVSVAHMYVSAGTLGAIVYDEDTGQQCLLSNWHVLEGGSFARQGDPILQPGPIDDGNVPDDVIATLGRSILGPDGDAAIAYLTGSRAVVPEQLDTGGVKVESARMPEDGEILEKSGRTTGVTRAKVDGQGRYFIDYSVGQVGVDGFKLVPEIHGNPTNEEISSGGDSGAIWYSPDSHEGVGLHFAGERSSDPSSEHAIACFLPRVLRALDISLTPVSAGVPALVKGGQNMPQNISVNQASSDNEFDIDIRISVRPGRSTESGIEGWTSSCGTCGNSCPICTPGCPTRGCPTSDCPPPVPRIRLKIRNQDVHPIWVKCSKTLGYGDDRWTKIEPGRRKDHSRHVGYRTTIKVSLDGDGDDVIATKRHRVGPDTSSNDLVYDGRRLRVR